MMISSMMGLLLIGSSNPLATTKLMRASGYAFRSARREADAWTRSPSELRRITQIFLTGFFAINPGYSHLKLK